MFKINLLSHMESRKVPVMSTIIFLLGSPLLIALQALLLKWGWNQVLAASIAGVETIGFWQAVLFMLVQKLCLRRLGKKTDPVPQSIKDTQPSVQ